MNGKLENSVGQIENKWGDKLTIFVNGIHLKTVGGKFWDISIRPITLETDKEILYDNLEQMVVDTLLFNSTLWFKVKGERDSLMTEASTLITFEGRKKAKIVKRQIEEIQKYDYPNYLKKKAATFEENLDYDSAIKIWDQLGETNESKRIRKLVAEQSAVKVSQKVVHGDQVTKTEIKDSVLNRSNVGGGSSKMQELEKLTEMKKEGLISEEEYEKMKREIIG